MTLNRLLINEFFFPYGWIVSGLKSDFLKAEIYLCLIKLVVLFCRGIRLWRDTPTGSQDYIFLLQQRYLTLGIIKSRKNRLGLWINQL